MTPFIKVPFAPRVAVALPSNAQYESSVAAFRPCQELSLNPGSRQAVPRSVPLASYRHSAFKGTRKRRYELSAGGKLRMPGVPSMITLEVQFSGDWLVRFGSRLASV